MKRIPFGGLKRVGPFREPILVPLFIHSQVTMKRIPFGGLKLNFNNFIPTQMPKRASDNEENPLRGIETPTRVIGRRKTSTNRDNEENPLRGIETPGRMFYTHMCTIVTMKRIPFGGLKP